jgi:hypothetical protein
MPPKAEPHHAADVERSEYRLLATSRASAQPEPQTAAGAGFERVGQTMFESLFGGKEGSGVHPAAERAGRAPKFEYQVLATTRTSTLQKKVQEVAAQGYAPVGMPLADTAMTGTELVVITRRLRQVRPSLRRGVGPRP